MLKIPKKIKNGRCSFVLVAVLSVVWLVGAGSAFGQAQAKGTPEGRALAVQELLDSVEGVAEEPPRIFKTKEGYLRFVMAPPSAHFAVDRVGTAEEAAKAFLVQRQNLFVNESSAVGFQIKRIKTRNSRTYVRYQQTYAGLPVFGAEMIVQVNAVGGIFAVISDIMRDTEALDLGEVSLNPVIDDLAGERKAIELLATQYEQLQFESSHATLMIFDPTVVGCKGPTQLVWQTKVGNIGELRVKEDVLVDAHSGKIAFHYPLIYTAMNRKIYDYENGTVEPSEPVLEDPPGGGDDPRYPTGIEDVDLAYEYLEDTYDFYYTEHDRDSYDNNGAVLDAKVRYNALDAWWMGSFMRIGTGCVTDDIVGHELTHGVTEKESDLLYANESGAINESFSDMWGEWVDLTNGAGTDTPAVRWLIGEDVVGSGAFRDMADPPQFNHPDRLYGDNWHPLADNPGPDNDWGGVHTNNGVGNKLCYLLTDGDKFNGYTISAMDVSTTADLIYECQTNLLTDSADYYDLGNVLQVAAINIGCTQTERENVEKGCRAVQITPNLMGWWKFDEGTGQITEDAAGDNDGTLGQYPNDPEWFYDDVDYHYQCLDFDENDEVTLSPIGALAGDSVTVSAWVKATNVHLNLNQDILNQSSGILGYRLYLRQGSPAFFLNNQYAEAQYDLDGYWHHLAGTYDGSDLKIYVDGIEERTLSYPDHKGTYRNAYIGHVIPSYGESFDGLIDDVRVYSYPLNQFQIWDAMSGDLPRFRIKNGSDETVAWFDSWGNLILKGEKLTDAEVPIPSGSFIVKNSAEDTVAYISNQGNLWIEGDLSETCESCEPTGDAFIIKNSSDNNVAYIDFADGDLCLTGKLYQKPEE